MSPRVQTGYSQNDEEAAILNFFNARPNEQRPLRFLDIGSHDGVTLSNTRRLAELGWSGTLVEPTCSAFQKLMDLYRGNQNMNLVNAAIVPASSPPLMRFYDARGDLVSTFDERQREVWSKDIPYQPIYVSPTTVAALLSTCPGPYPFINLDVEGLNFEVFKELPLQELGVELICVEYQECLEGIEKHALAQGYTRHYITVENVLLAR